MFVVLTAREVTLRGTLRVLARCYLARICAFVLRRLLLITFQRCTVAIMLREFMVLVILQRLLLQRLLLARCKGRSSPWGIIMGWGTLCGRLARRYL